MLTATEMGRLFAKLDDARFTRLRPVVMLAAYAGLRVGEIIALRWQDVDLDDAWIHGGTGRRRRLHRREAFRSRKTWQVLRKPVDLRHVGRTTRARAAMGPPSSRREHQAPVQGRRRPCT
jgi:integrase